LCLLLKKVALLFCPGEARETSQIGLINKIHGLINKIFSRLINKIQGLSRIAKKIQDFPGCDNPVLHAAVLCS